MFRRLFFLITIGLGLNFATYSQCVTNATATLNYVSSSGANCTFNFTPSAIINNTPNVKMVQFTFPAGSSPSSVCYSGTPIALVPCSGSYTSISNNTTLVTLPLATITMPCSGSSLTYRAPNCYKWNWRRMYFCNIFDSYWSKSSKIKLFQRYFIGKQNFS